jgi:hypothetical protein
MSVPCTTCRRPTVYTSGARICVAATCPGHETTTGTTPHRTASHTEHRATYTPENTSRTDLTRDVTSTATATTNNPSDTAPEPHHTQRRTQESGTPHAQARAKLRHAHDQNTAQTGEARLAGASRRREVRP